MSDPRPDGDLLARLAAHRAIGSAPRAELEWLVAHGTLERYVPGDMIARKGQPVEALYIILNGHVAHFTDQGGAMRKAVDWHDGDATGMLACIEQNLRQIAWGDVDMRRVVIELDLDYV